MTRYVHTKEQLQIRKRIGIAGVVVGIGVLAVAIRVQTLPQPLWLFALALIAFIYLEWHAVEVNSRLSASPSVMILVVSVVIFGSSSGILVAILMAVTGAIVPSDIRERSVFKPAVNFGQMIVTAAVAATILALIAGDTVGGVHPPETFWAQTRIVVAATVAAVSYSFIQYKLISGILAAIYGSEGTNTWSHTAQIVTPFIGMGTIGGLLGIAYLTIGTVALPLIAIVTYIGYMAFESYAHLRQAQHSTLAGFIKALEVKDLYTRGHTERVAHLSSMIGQHMGYSGTELETIRWAALIHDVGKLAVPRHLIRKKARLTTDEQEQMEQHVEHVEHLLDQVTFLQPMVTVAANHHAWYNGDGYHGSSGIPGEQPDIKSCILSVADSFDAMTSSRPYRVALTQRYAIKELQDKSGTQFHPDVVDAFVEALERSGEQYGSPFELTDSQAREHATSLPTGYNSETDLSPHDVSRQMQ